MDPDVIGAVGHTVRLAAPKVRRDGSHKFCRPFVVGHSRRRVDIRQEKLPEEWTLHYQQNGRFKIKGQLRNRCPDNRDTKQIFKKV